MATKSDNRRALEAQLAALDKLLSVASDAMRSVDAALAEDASDAGEPDQDADDAQSAERTAAIDAQMREIADLVAQINGRKSAGAREQKGNGGSDEILATDAARTVGVNGAHLVYA